MSMPKDPEQRVQRDPQSAKHVPKVAFIGFGEVNTPKEVIAQKCNEAVGWLKDAGLDVTATEPVSDDPAGVTAQSAVACLEGSNCDVVIACLAGWIPSYAVIRVLSEFQHYPVILWGLSASKQGERLVTTADQAGTTALRQTLEDLGYTFKYVPNYANAEPRVEEIATYARAAQAKRKLLNAKIGMMGYRDMNLYATLHDGVSLRKQLGLEVEVFEMLEMVQRAECLNRAEVESLVDAIQSSWEFQRPPDPGVLEKGVRYYLALRQIVEERGYQGISLTDVNGMKKLLQLPPAMVFMLLADRLGQCTIPENDTLGAVSQLITRNLTGQIGAYLEFYEFFTDGFLMGVPDYVPAEVVDGPVRVTPTSFGNLPGGVLNVSRLKTGEVTLCRLARRRDRYVLHLVAATARPPMAWEEAGWSPPAPQLPGLKLQLHGDMERFSEHVMGQHYILSYGDNRSLFREFCKIADIDVIE